MERVTSIWLSIQFDLQLYKQRENKTKEKDESFFFFFLCIQVLAHPSSICGQRDTSYIRMSNESCVCAFLFLLICHEDSNHRSKCPVSFFSWHTNSFFSHLPVYSFPFIHFLCLSHHTGTKGKETWKKIQMNHMSLSWSSFLHKTHPRMRMRESEWVRMHRSGEAGSSRKKRGQIRDPPRFLSFKLQTTFPSLSFSLSRSRGSNSPHAFFLLSSWSAQRSVCCLHPSLGAGWEVGGQKAIMMRMESQGEQVTILT